MIDASDILSVTTNVTKKWTNQRKAEERNWRSRAGRQFVYSDRVDFTEVAAQILPQAYAHASGNGTFTVNQRNMYYASRDAFHERTGRHIDYQYFASTIVTAIRVRQSTASAGVVKPFPSQQERKADPGGGGVPQE